MHSLRQISGDFKSQCFYCGNLCVFDRKHPDRNKFVEVRTISNTIHKLTLDICKTRDDETGRIVETRLLGVSDLVAAEAKYHVSCRIKFENPLPEYATPGRPISSTKTILFENACKILEDDMELYTVTEFHELMSKLGDDVYSVKITQMKLKEKYKESMRLVTREGKSNIILLNRTAKILCEKWYEDRKLDLDHESERIIKTAAALIKGAVKNHELETSTYPSVDDIATANNQIPKLLAIFIDELIRSPIKQMSISQALFNATRPRAVMPLQFGLAVCTDNRIGSKWLNTLLLSKLGFAASYDEVRNFFTFHGSTRGGVG